MKQCSKCKIIKPLEDFGQYKSGVNKGCYRSYCKICATTYTKENRKRKWLERPWEMKWRGISNRCDYKGHHYFEKGIKNLLTKDDVKYLWFRDSAFSMKKPSIDRINPDGHYLLENCRFIELKENNDRCRKRTPVAQYTLDGQFIQNFKSVCAAGRAVDRYNSGVFSAASGVQKSCAGYKWKFVKVI